MLRAAFVLALLVATALTGAIGTAAASADAPLHVILGHGRPHIQHAAAYTAARPIEVRVDGRRARGPVSVVGVSPAGENLRVPLTRRPGGDYAGTITLPTPGVWSLAIATDGAVASTGSFAVAVAAQAPVWGVMTSLLLAILCVAGGIAMIAYGMRRRPAA
jgi:hypothetical protein